MSALIKASAARALPPVRIVTAAPSLTLSASKEEPYPPDPRDAAIERLESALAGMADERANTAIAHEQALVAARAEGVRAGAAGAEEREADRCAILEHAISEARVDFEARIDRLEALAPALAGRAIGKLVDRIDWHDLAAETVASQVARLRQTVVGVRVAPGLIQTASARGIANLTVDPALPEGTARIACTLGDVEIDVGAAVATLVDHLDCLAVAT